MSVLKPLGGAAPREVSEVRGPEKTQRATEGGLSTAGLGCLPCSVREGGDARVGCHRPSRGERSVYCRRWGSLVQGVRAQVGCRGHPCWQMGWGRVWELKGGAGVVRRKESPGKGTELFQVKRIYKQGLGMKQHGTYKGLIN